MLQCKTIPFDWLKRMLIAVGFVLAPGIAHAVSLSGTVQYTGAQGPVSSTRPILMLLWNTPSPMSNPLVGIAVAANGPFDVEAPTAGQYYLAYLLDVNGDGRPSVGEPFQVFQNRLNFPGDPIMVPQTGVTLSFDDTAVLSGIAGTVTYTGTHGPVSNQERLIVQAFRDAALTDEATDSEHQKTNGSRYDLVTLDTNTYYVRAFLDVNGNRQFDSGEPFTVYNHRGTPPFDPVMAGTQQTGIDITFGDENLGGMPTPTPTPIPIPSTCAGDCDGSGTVTVNNVVTLVDITFGTAQPSACPSGIPSGKAVDITLIVQAVNNALNGCPGATATSTPQPTATPTTAAGNESVCGGSITSVPKLCNLTVQPNSVPPGGDATLTLSGSDLEGDDNTLCSSIVPTGSPPNLKCSHLNPPNMTFNQSFSIGPVQAVPQGTPPGEYTVTIQVRDAAGHQSNLVSADFTVVGSAGVDPLRSSGQCSGSTTGWLQARMLSDCAAHSRHTSIRTVPSGCCANEGASLGSSSNHRATASGVV